MNPYDDEEEPSNGNGNGAAKGVSTTIATTKKTKLYEGYDMSIEPNEQIDDDDDDDEANGDDADDYDRVDNGGKSRSLLGASKPVNVAAYFAEMAERDHSSSSGPGAYQDPFAEKRVQTIADRERGTYNEKRQRIELSPGVRYDPFAEGSETPDLHSVRRTTAAVLRETHIRNERQELEYKLREKAKAGELRVVDASVTISATTSSSTTTKKRRWDQAATTAATEAAAAPSNGSTTQAGAQAVSFKDMETPAHVPAIWEATPGHADSGALTPPSHSGASETPKVSAAGGRRRWDETPKTERGGADNGETPHISGWAETPKIGLTDHALAAQIKQQASESSSSQVTISASSTVAAARKRSRWDETPVGSSLAAGDMTPSAANMMATPTPSGNVGLVVVLFSENSK